MRFKRFMYNFCWLYVFLRLAALINSMLNWDSHQRTRAFHHPLPLCAPVPIIRCIAYFIFVQLCAKFHGYGKYSNIYFLKTSSFLLHWNSGTVDIHKHGQLLISITIVDSLRTTSKLISLTYLTYVLATHLERPTFAVDFLFEIRSEWT